MSEQNLSSIDTLIIQYPQLQYTKQQLPYFLEPLFDMPVPVLPHKRGDIILSAHSSIANTEPPHRHNYFLINYACRGDYKIQAMGQDLVLHEHELFLSQPYVSHSLYAHESPDDVILSIRLRKELLLRSLMPVLPKNESLLDFFITPLNMRPESLHKYLIFHVDTTLEIMINHAIEAMIEEYVGMQPGYDTLLDTNLATLLALLSRHYTLNQSTKDKQSQSELLINQILQYASNNCATTNLNKIADEFHYHPNYLSTLLQKQTGQTFSELIRHFRLQRAYSLLANSDLPIEEIAVLVGYPHTSNFYRTFRQDCGVSPKQYRLNARKDPNIPKLM